MDELSLPNEPSPGSRVLRLAADRWREASEVSLRGAGLSISPSPSPLTASAPVHCTQSFKFLRHPRDLKKSPSFSPSWFRPLHSPAWDLVITFYLILLLQFPPSPNLHRMPPPRSQGMSLIKLLYTRIEKARLFSTTLKCPHSLLSTTLSALHICTHPMFSPNSSESSNIPITFISVPFTHVVSLSAWKCIFLLFTFLFIPRGLAHMRPFPRSRRSFRPSQSTALCLSHSPCPLSILEVCTHALFRSVSSALAEFES